MTDGEPEIETPARPPRRRLTIAEIMGWIVAVAAASASGHPGVILVLCLCLLDRVLGALGLTDGRRSLLVVVAFLFVFWFFEVRGSKLAPLWPRL